MLALWSTGRGEVMDGRREGISFLCMLAFILLLVVVAMLVAAAMVAVVV